MNQEDQRFLALEGLYTWLTATITQAERIEASVRDMRVPEAAECRHEAARRFRSERNLFLVAANQATVYIAWVKALKIVEDAVFSKFDELSAEIKDLRQKNEHVIEYFFEEFSCSADEGGLTDASSTIEDGIGGRLSWKVVAAAAKRLRQRLPAGYDSRKCFVPLSRKAASAPQGVHNARRSLTEPLPFLHYFGS